MERRITIAEGKPHADGPIVFGASSHATRFMIRIHDAFQTIRAGINFAYDPELTIFLGDYCKKKNWPLIPIYRPHETDEIKAEEDSMPWKAG